VNRGREIHANLYVTLHYSRMHVLLLRPAPGNDRFGLGPFFRIEPLGMEYIASVLEARGHHVTLADLRFSRPLERQIAVARPQLVGIAAMHALETDDVLALARRVRQLIPSATIVVGGHTAAAYPSPFLEDPVDAVVLDDGERAVAAIADAVQRGRALRDVPGLAVRDSSGQAAFTPADPESFELDDVPLPARHHVAPWRRQYACLAHRPAWLVETARGCPFRCSFCSIWQLHHRSVRERSIDSVCADFAAVSDHVFIADDLFWYHPSRSLALARELRRRGIRKEWILVQSRVDLVARQASLLEAWRPLARQFDIFFGLEAATNQGLNGLMKDSTIDQTAEGVGVARSLNYGVTGNFVIDPAWSEPDFERLWAFVEQHQLFQAGFTILTPLPGTQYFDEVRPRLRARRWSQFDMHHLLWEPALGAARFFELYCETWRRSVLNLRGRKSVWRWLREVDPRNALFLLNALRRTQRMMDPLHYLEEHDLGAPGINSQLTTPNSQGVPIERAG
jgi:hopanoid C-3 methylase